MRFAIKAILFCLLTVQFVLPRSVSGQINEASEAYSITSFDSTLTVNKNTNLIVQEKITVVFNEQRRGIFRVIPYTHTTGLVTKSTAIKVLSVVDDNGNPHPYKLEREAQSIRIRIGDPEIYITGRYVYKITYLVRDVIVRFDEHDEVYWNVTGSQWDTSIQSASANVTSEHAQIIEVGCYAGRVGTNQADCTSSNSEKSAHFTVDRAIVGGEDFTIVLALNKKNNLVYPSVFKSRATDILANWGYIPAVIPAFLMFILWYKRGRDKRYLTDNIYYKPDDEAVKSVPVFERRHVPTVYYPLDGVTPSEVGTLIDERVDIHDVVAEILELARLKFIKIVKIEKKKLIKHTDYAFIKTDKFNSTEKVKELEDYQQYLLKEIFKSLIVDKSVKKAGKLFKNNDSQLEEVRKMLSKSEYVLLSAMRYSFYESLKVFKDKLYKRMETRKIFDANPEAVRKSYVGVYVAMVVVATGALVYFYSSSFNFGPFIFLLLGIIPGIAFALSMPRRTAYGYSLLRQALGLRWYINKGKWRHEIAEKHLFIEEILPLAVTLGVVNKLANDMKTLQISPPDYFKGSSFGSFAGDLRSFNKTASSTILSTHSSSGGSSWSGGSGFSGGGGGGFGGGGGGSW